MRPVLAGLALVTAAWLLGMLTLDVSVAPDIALGTMLGLRADEQPLLVAASQAVTRLGDAAVRPFLIAALVGVLLWQRQRLDALVLLAGSLASVALITWLKHDFQRVRPQLVPWLDDPANASYPSGHAGNTLAILLLFALLLGRRRAVAAALVLGGLVGLTRPLLGVHWVSDVLGGWLAGGGVALIAYGLARYRAEPLPAQTRSSLRSGTGSEKPIVHR